MNFLQRNKSVLFFVICAAILVGVVWFASNPGGGAAADPVDAPFQASAIVTKVSQTDQYTYMRLALSKDKEIWIASPRMDVQEYERVVFEGSTLMQDFYSPTLGMTFPEILFVEVAAVVDLEGNVVRTSAGPDASLSGAPDDAIHNAASGAPTGPQVAADPAEPLPPPEGGITLAALVESHAQRGGQEVVLRGKVVKVSPAIMGTNWYHLRDGSAPGEKGDVTFTSNEVIPPGAIVRVRGTVEINDKQDQFLLYDFVVRASHITVEDNGAAAEGNTAKENGQ